MMTRRNLTDRAHRYRANRMAPAGPKVCALCGSRSNITVDHKNGKPDDTRRSNLQYLCKSCNTAKGFSFRNSGKGRLTKQYNPPPTFEQYRWAVTNGERIYYAGGSSRHSGTHDEAGAIIHATPKHLRREYAARISGHAATTRRAKADKRWNPEPERFYDQLEARKRARELESQGYKGVRVHQGWEKREPHLPVAYYWVKYNPANRRNIFGLSAKEKQESSKLRARLERERTLDRAAAPYYADLASERARVREAHKLAREERIAAKREQAEENRRIKREEAEAKREESRQAKEQHAELISALVNLGAPKSEARAAAEKAARGGGSFDDQFRRALDSVSKKNPAKFDRCVRAVQAKGGTANAYAVCRAAIKGNPSIFDLEDAWRAGRERAKELGSGARSVSASAVSGQFSSWWSSYGGSGSKADNLREYKRGWSQVVKGNPADAAAAVFEEFHGYPSKELVTVTSKRHHHQHLAAAGELEGLEVRPVDGGPIRRLHLKDSFLTFNEQKNQLFITGGDQFLSDAELKKFGIASPHELETLGQVKAVGYFTDKTHLGDDGGEAIYSHTFRSTNKAGRHVLIKIAREPELIYRVLDQQLEFSGGSYTIRAEGIDK